MARFGSSGSAGASIPRLIRLHPTTRRIKKQPRRWSRTYPTTTPAKRPASWAVPSTPGWSAPGPTARLPEGLTWEKLAALSPDDIRDKGLFPKGFLPLPHVKHDVGGMVFPPLTIKELPRMQKWLQREDRNGRMSATG